MFWPAIDIVDDAMLEKVSDNDVVLPKKELIKRVANRLQVNKRPQEPNSFEFEVSVKQYSFKLFRRTYNVVKELCQIYCLTTVEYNAFIYVAY